jgi:DNA mismatch endonuclease (patch repair protein)
MTDIVDKKTRSRMMKGIRSTDTKPEMQVRRALHAKGFRYKLHEKGLPGRPDLYFPKYKAIIQINGCFWHKHDCKYFKWPSSRPDFWRSKLEANAVRDKRNIYLLNEHGLRTLVVWECALRGQSKEAVRIQIQRIADWLISDSGSNEIP